MFGPGDYLCPKSEAVAGRGTYVRDDGVYASRLGAKVLSETATSGRVVEIRREGEEEVPIPQPGKEIYARITRFVARAVNVEILAVDETPLKQAVKGQIRLQDISQKMPDSVVVIADCYRPGDIIRAKVLYHSDAYGFCLSTKEDHLGVIHAESSAGQSMITVDKNTMKCSTTNIQEKRKVASRGL